MSFIRFIILIGGALILVRLAAVISLWLGMKPF
jgi:hypothetical protein